MSRIPRGANERLSEREITDLVALYERGEKMSVICARFNVTDNTVRRWVAKRGTPGARSRTRGANASAGPA